MPYKVINSFYDKEDDNTLYKVGDDFPREGAKANRKRLEELSKENPQHKKAFIEKVEVKEE